MPSTGPNARRPSSVLLRLSPILRAGIRIQILKLRRVFLVSQQLAVIFRRTVYGVENVGQDELILLRFFLRNICGIFQVTQFRLKLGIGLNDHFQRLANVVLAIDVGVDIVVEFVVEQLKIIEQVVRLPRPVLDFGVASYLLQLHQPRPRELNVEGQTLFRFPTGVANLVNLRLRKRLAMALSLRKEPPSATGLRTYKSETGKRSFRSFRKHGHEQIVPHSFQAVDGVSHRCLVVMTDQMQDQ